MYSDAIGVFGQDASFKKRLSLRDVNNGFAMFVDHNNRPIAKEGTKASPSIHQIIIHSV